MASKKAAPEVGAMKFTITREVLATALAAVARAVSTRSTLPVLGNILIRAEENKVFFAATNLEVGIKAHVDVSIDVPGSTTVPAKSFIEMIGNISDETIALELNAHTQTLTIKYGKSKSNFKCIDASEFPPIPTGNILLAEINGTTFREAVSQIAHCISADEARPVLTGIHCVLGDGQITLNAADGFQLVQKTVTAVVSKPRGFIVPGSAMIEAARLTSGTVSLYAMEGNQGAIFFKSGNYELISQLIAGQYPDLSVIMNGAQKGAIEIVLPKTAFLQAVKRADIFARDDSKLVRFDITVGDPFNPGKVQVSSMSGETGETSSDIEGAITGDNISIAFNAKFVQSWLNTIKTPQVQMKFSVSSSPGIFKPMGDDTVVQVIMPMHTA